MTRSRFRLASVLAYRESQFDEAIQEMARVETRVHNVESALGQIWHERASTLSRSMPGETTRAADLRLAVQYLSLLDLKERALLYEARILEDQLVKARAMVVMRHQTVDVLTRLRERQAAMARQEFEHLEQRNLDEIASIRTEYRRQRGGSPC